MNVEKFIKENALKICPKTYVAPDIPENKLNNAIKSFAPEVDPNYVIAINDTSLIGTAKEGCLFLGDCFYTKAMLEKPHKVEFKNIKDAKYNVRQVTKSNGKTTEVKESILTFKDDSTLVLNAFVNDFSYKAFAEIIKEIVEGATSEESFVSTNQNIPLSDLNNAIQIGYLKLICNFAFSDDGSINPAEYSEIMALMVRNKMRQSTRIEIRAYMNDKSQCDENNDLIEYLEMNIDNGSISLIKQSLMKDILNIYSKQYDPQEWSSNEFIVKLQERLEIKEDQIKLFLESIQRDKDILEKRLNDSEIKKSLIDLSANAAAVGVPLAAIYFSGSVTGMSAAGLTSGLASLGMGGVLGFSGMVTGIGIAVLIGVGSYRGLKKITGVSDLENNKQREIMLQEIIKNQQMSLNYIIEDINEISRRLMDEIRKGKMNESKITQLASMMAKLPSGAQITSNKISHAEYEKLLTKLPRKLNRLRFDELITSATDKQIAPFILACYEEDTIGNEWILKESLSLNELQELIDALEAVGYSNIKDAAVASAKVSLKQASEATSNFIQDMKRGDYAATEEAVKEKTEATVNKAKGFAKNLFENFK